MRKLDVILQLTNARASAVGQSGLNPVTSGNWNVLLALL
jgi:hypothetical protein